MTMHVQLLPGRNGSVISLLDIKLPTQITRFSLLWAIHEWQTLFHPRNDALISVITQNCLKNVTFIFMII